MITRRVSYQKLELHCLLFARIWVHHRFLLFYFGEILVVHIFSFLFCVFYLFVFVLCFVLPVFLECLFCINHSVFFTLYIQIVQQKTKSNHLNTNHKIFSSICVICFPWKGVAFFITFFYYCKVLLPGYLWPLLWLVKAISWIFITNPKSCLVHTGLQRIKAS